MNIVEIDPEMCRKFLEAEKTTQNEYTLTSLLKAVGNVFRLAVEKEWIQKNPFKGLVERHEHNEETEFYVTREMIGATMRFATTDAQRFALILGRFAGLRIPSEIRFMRFGDFKEDTFTVHEDTKTGKRVVPFFHELREPFHKLRYGKRDGDFVFPRSLVNPGYLGHRFRLKISEANIDLCGLGPGVPWPRFFVNLRSSCITDYSNLGYSEKTLNAIFGNSEQVRKKHYIQMRKRNEYRKILNDNAAIIDILREHGGRFDDPSDFEYCIRELIFRKTLVDLARDASESGISGIFPN